MRKRGLSFCAVQLIDIFRNKLILLMKMPSSFSYWRSFLSRADLREHNYWINSVILSDLGLLCSSTHAWTHSRRLVLDSEILYTFWKQWPWSQLLIESPLHPYSYHAVRYEAARQWGLPALPAWAGTEEITALLNTNILTAIVWCRCSVFWILSFPQLTALGPIGCPWSGQ